MPRLNPSRDILTRHNHVRTPASPPACAQSLEVRELPAGARAVTEGDAGNEFFIILSGSVTVRATATSGGEVTLATMAAPHHFGDVTLTGPPGTRRRATVACATRCRFAVVHRKAWDRCAASMSDRIWCTTSRPAAGRHVQPNISHASAKSVANASCREFSVLSRVQRSRRVRRYIKDHVSVATPACVRTLKRVPVFAELGDSKLRTLAQVATPHAFAPNTIVVRQGDTVDDLYVIASGYTKLIRELPKRTQVYRPGEFLPESGHAQPYWAAAAARGRYAAVQSPVKAYCDVERERRRAARRQESAQAVAGKAAVLAAAKAKVRGFCVRTSSGDMSSAVSLEREHVVSATLAHMRLLARLSTNHMGSVMVPDLRRVVALQLFRAVDKISAAQADAKAGEGAPAARFMLRGVDRVTASQFQYKTSCETEGHLFMEARPSVLLLLFRPPGSQLSSASRDHWAQVRSPMARCVRSRARSRPPLRQTSCNAATSRAQVATASAGEFFGEEAVQRDVRVAATVLTQSAVATYALNKWDLLKLFSGEQVAELLGHSRFGAIEDEKLLDAFYACAPVVALQSCGCILPGAAATRALRDATLRVCLFMSVCLQLVLPGAQARCQDAMCAAACRHGRWEHFRAQLVARVLEDRDIRYLASPKNFWERFRDPKSGKRAGKAWA
jgi:CRP-like cAMP-binding protein